jgi:hypothetical protein
MDTLMCFSLFFASQAIFIEGKSNSVMSAAALEPAALTDVVFDVRPSKVRVTGWGCPMHKGGHAVSFA